MSNKKTAPQQPFEGYIYDLADALEVAIANTTASSVTPDEAMALYPKIRRFGDTNIALSATLNRCRGITANDRWIIGELDALGNDVIRWRVVRKHK